MNLHEGFLLQGVHDDGGNGWKKETKSAEFWLKNKKKKYTNVHTMPESSCVLYILCCSSSTDMINSETNCWFLEMSFNLQFCRKDLEFVVSNNHV